MLQGKKTYLVAALVVVIACLHALGALDDELYKTLLALLGAGAIATMRAALGREGF
jgi:hypothetical protein